MLSAADLIARWRRRDMVCWYKMSDQTDFCRDSSKCTQPGDFQPSNQSDQLTFSVSFSGDQRLQYTPFFYVVYFLLGLVFYFFYF